MYGLLTLAIIAIAMSLIFYACHKFHVFVALTAWIKSTTEEKVGLTKLVGHFNANGYLVSECLNISQLIFQRKTEYKFIIKHDLIKCSYKLRMTWYINICKSIIHFFVSCQLSPLICRYADINICDQWC